MKGVSDFQIMLTKVTLTYLWSLLLLNAWRIALVNVHPIISYVDWNNSTLNKSILRDIFWDKKHTFLSNNIKGRWIMSEGVNSSRIIILVGRSLIVMLWIVISLNMHNIKSYNFNNYLLRRDVTKITIEELDIVENMMDVNSFT